MKSDRDKAPAPRALQEVWEWKESVWEDVKDLPFEEAVRIVARRAHETALTYGFHTVETPAHPMRVAETRNSYGAKTQ